MGFDKYTYDKARKVTVKTCFDIRTSKSTKVRSFSNLLKGNLNFGAKNAHSPLSLLNKKFKSNNQNKNWALFDVPKVGKESNKNFRCCLPPFCYSTKCKYLPGVVATTAAAAIA